MGGKKTNFPDHPVSLEVILGVKTVRWSRVAPGNYIQNGSGILVNRDFFNIARSLFNFL